MNLPRASLEAHLDVTYFIDQNYGPENKDRNAWVTTPKDWNFYSWIC